VLTRIASSREMIIMFHLSAAASVGGPGRSDFAPSVLTPLVRKDQGPLVLRRLTQAFDREADRVPIAVLTPARLPRISSSCLAPCPAIEGPACSR